MESNTLGIYIYVLVREMAKMMIYIYIYRKHFIVYEYVCVCTCIIMPWSSGREPPTIGSVIQQMNTDEVDKRI